MNKNRWLVTALVVSLGINILFAGVVIGRAISGPPPGAHKPIHLGMVMRHLDEETVKALRPQLLKLRKDMLPLRTEMRDAQTAFTQLLMSDNVNEDALATAQKRLADASSALQSKMHEHMAVTLKAVPPEQRQRVLRSMERRRHRGDRSDNNFPSRDDRPPRPPPSP